MLISQSFIKQYHTDPCTYRVKRQYIDGERVPPTEAMTLGILFERGLIGASATDEHIDFPKTLKGELTADSKRLMEAIDNAKKVLEDNNVEIIETQLELKTDIAKGTLDAVGTVRGEGAIIDIKYTLTAEDDKWEFGWADLSKKDLTQAKQYVWLYEQIYHKRLPFYYIVFGASGWVKMWRVRVDEHALIAHAEAVELLSEKIKTETWEAAPEYSRCRKCHFKDTCPFFGWATVDVQEFTVL
jgi:CRISPR/Cas system-associated exonuclease Cas4 (RecB family)